METFSALLASCAGNTPVTGHRSDYVLLISPSNADNVTMQFRNPTIVTQSREKWYLTRLVSIYSMMTSSNGNIFRVTGSLCAEFTGPGVFPTQRPVTRSFGVFFDLLLNKPLSKQQWGWWFETPSWSLWRQCNARAYSRQIVWENKNDNEDNDNNDDNDDDDTENGNNSKWW